MENVEEDPQAVHQNKVAGCRNAFRAGEQSKVVAGDDYQQTGDSAE